jgi:universal stress protein A
VEIDKILVPVDFSECSQGALDEAIELARKFDAELHLLHCYPIHPVGPAAPYDVMLPPSIEQTIQESARGLLAEWERKVAGRGVKARKHLSPGAPASEISELAHALGVDLIVMGTRGLSGLEHVLLGSVAERTIRRAPCPVLTVKHGPVHP